MTDITRLNECMEELGERPIRTSQALINEATYEVNMANVVNNQKNNPLVEAIFLATDTDEDENRFGGNYQEGLEGMDEVNFNAFPQRNFETKIISETFEGSGIKLLGKIHHIDHANGHGYLHGVNNVYDNLIFFRNTRNTEEFNELEKYDIVEFEVAQNAKGDYATNVRYSGVEEPQQTT